MTNSNNDEKKKTTGVGSKIGTYSILGRMGLLGEPAWFKQLNDEYARYIPSNVGRKPSGRVLACFGWMGTIEQLDKLYSLLRKYSYVGNTSFITFAQVFSDISLSDICEGIKWLKMAKNKYTNKRSIGDLIQILTDKKFIQPVTHKLPIMLSGCFTDAEGSPLKFTYSNIPSDDYSEHRQELESIINEL